MKKFLLFFFFAFVFSFSESVAQNLPSYSVTALDSQSAGYYFFVPIKIGPGSGVVPTHMILDHNGEVVYYKKFPTGSTGDFKLHTNGLISYSRPGKFYLMDSTFNVIDSVVPKNGMLYDGHDLQILPNGNFVILGYENETMDLSSYNLFNGNSSPGSASATVKCGVIQEQDVNKNVVFEWHCKDHYAFTDVDTFWLTNPNNVDWTHLNAVEYDSDGNYMLSVRHFNEITKIKRSDSTIMWRLGGNANQFTFINDPQKFIAQHDCRRISNGNITLFDNGKLSPLHASAAKEYQLDEISLTATLAWSYVENSNTFSRALGNHQRLPNGNSVINYGMLNNLNHVFNVVKPNGDKVFEIVFADTLRSYRSFNYASFPWNLKRPEIYCLLSNGQAILTAESGHASYLWSNGATTQTLLVTNTGTFSVFVPKGQGGFISSHTFTVSDIAAPCLTASIKERDGDEQPVVFPNPFSELLTVKVPDGVKGKLEMYNLLGMKIYSGEITGKHMLNTVALPKGVYFLKVNNVTKKVIKE